MIGFVRMEGLEFTPSNKVTMLSEIKQANPILS